jgi:hypothetical protein
MLPFYYTFLILILSSSAIAMPPPLHRPKSEPLIGSRDKRLQGTLWGQVIWSETPNAVMKWAGNAQCLDYTLRFVVTDGAGVQQVEISKVQRKLQRKNQVGRPPAMPKEEENNEYRVVRPNDDKRRPATRDVVLEPEPIDQCRPHLHDSYWARNSDILGKVSDGLMMWKPWLHALLCALQANSGNKENWGDIIHIQWKTIDRVEVPYVTFNPADKEGKTFLKAQNSYELDGVEAAMVKAAMVKDDDLQKDWKSAALLGNTDVRLRNSLWSRVTFKSPTDVADEKWTNDAQYLDDVLSFEAGLGTAGLGVGEVEFSRIKRQLGEHNWYHVVRPHEGSDDLPAERDVLLNLPINDECRPHLDHTYWGLNPEILGKVSDSLMIWKSLLHALLWALQQFSGQDQYWGYIMHIKWKPIGPRGGAEVPCVTFMPAEKLRVTVLEAKESFELNDQEAAVPGHMWLTGFRSPREPLLTEEILYDTYRWP